MSIASKFVAVALAVSVLAAAAAVTAGAASAQEPAAAPIPTHRQQARQAFLGHLAANLGVTLDQLKQATRDAALQTVDDLVADGTITAEQGAKLKEAVNSGKPGAIVRFLRQHPRSEFFERLRRGIVRSAASAIGVEPNSLATELRDGKSIADVAAEHNVSLDTVKSHLTSDAKAALDKAVANGRLTQARADELLAKLSVRLDDILNKKRS